MQQGLMEERKDKEISPLMGEISQYISSALSHPIPTDVQQRAKYHALDTIAAMVSGSRLLPGEMAIKFARTQGGTSEAVVIGSDIVTTTINAALANGMLAHADETDDSHKGSRSHLGCGVVPAALAMAEKRNSSGADFLKSVALGYDIGARMSFALGVDSFYDAGRSTHSFAPLFGAAASAGALAGLNKKRGFNSPVQLYPRYDA
jgi:2-methylcitrate dehydratase PrpD